MIRRLAAACAAFCTMFVSAPAFAYTPHVLRYADNLDVSSLNPFFATTGNTQPLQELTAAEFTRFDAKGDPLPELVTVIPTKANHGVSADGKTITWHLRRGLKWSDGQPLTADDVVYTFAVASDTSNNLSVRDPWERLQSVQAPNPTTVVFHFKSPYSLFIADYFSMSSNSAILPKHILGPKTAINEAPYNALPVGAGPFRFSAYHRGDGVEMEPNPYYWRGQPKLKQIVYKIVTDDNTIFTQLQTGELELWDLINGTLAQRAKTLPGHAYQTRLSNFMSAVFLNNAHAVAADPMVRRALAYATDRRLILDKVVLGNGVLTESVIPRTSVDYAQTPFTPFDLGRAAKMLDAAGWKAGPGGTRAKNGTPLTLDIAIPSGYAPSALVANILHDDWGKVGVGVTIHTYATPQFFAIYANGGTVQTGKFDGALFSQGLGPIFSNINGGYGCADAPPAGQNAGRYCDKAADTLNDRYLHSFDPAERHRIAAEMQRRIDADEPAIVMYERTFLSAYDRRLTGYHPSSYSYWGDPLQLDI